MANLMRIHYIAGINSDRVQVSIENQEEKLFSEDYAFGYNASSSRKNAEYSRQDHENAIKYGWKTAHPFKPFIGDIINELKENFQINEQDIVYSGYNVFNGKDFAPEDIEQFANRLK